MKKKLIYIGIFASLLVSCTESLDVPFLVVIKSLRRVAAREYFPAA